MKEGRDNHDVRSQKNHISTLGLSATSTTGRPRALGVIAEPGPSWSQHVEVKCDAFPQDLVNDLLDALPATVAQLVEQLIGKGEVVGANLADKDPSPR